MHWGERKRAFVEISEHDDVGVGIGGQQLGDEIVDERGLGETLGEPAIGRWLDATEEGWAAKLGREVAVNYRQLGSLEIERGLERFAAVAEGVVFNAFHRTNQGHPTGLVEVRNADIAPRLAAVGSVWGRDIRVLIPRTTGRSNGGNERLRRLVR